MMNRRVFVKLGIFSAGAMTLPLLHCRSNDQYNILLQQPSFLSQICDEKALREIGVAYVKLKPEEKKANRLVDLLTVDSGGKKLSREASDKEVESFLKNKIHADFEKNDTVTVNGWVLSLTEARQCALFSQMPL
jgi:hypothetical protein